MNVFVCGFCGGTVFGCHVCCNGNANNCDCSLVESCGVGSVHETVSKFTGQGQQSTSSSAAVSNTNVAQSVIVASSRAQHMSMAPSIAPPQQGIWSNMKHLMKHGSHGHVSHQQFSHVHVYTLARNNPAAPNVVDLTNPTESKSESSKVGGNGGLKSKGKTRIPWSNQSRMIRNATIANIAPSLQPSV